MKEEDVLTLIRYRLEQAQTALDDAKFLMDGGRSTQSITNRAYNAMFYASLALMQKLGKFPSKHTGVISLFDVEFVQKGIFQREMSKDFHKAFELRQVSDYKSYEPISTERANDILVKAANFVRLVKNYLDAESQSNSSVSHPT